MAYEGEALSYGELNARANRLAHHLRELGEWGPTCAWDCASSARWSWSSGSLGILKAGGAYVPLDPTYPRERLAFMIDDAKLPLVVTQGRLVGHLPTPERRGRGAGCRRGDSRWIGWTTPCCSTLPQHLAYVIYTSGSTGVPKAVAVPHRAVLRLVCGTEYARMDAAQTFLHLSSISFDASTFELWGPLLHGGRCVLFPNRPPTAEELGRVIREHGVTTVWLTASLFNTVLDEDPEALSSVRQLLIGGETLSVAHVRRAQKLLPDTEIINGYGPTESATFTCCHPIARELGADAVSVPIGRPIANTQVYLLDPRLNPVPVGIPGELCIGGDGLARGYLNRPDLTAERFIPDPFGEDGRRLYRTGDLARWLPDGVLEFLGRADQQVKIHGFRIELEEIEAVLRKHPAVQLAVVVVREDEPGDRRLVAYVVTGDENPTTSELRGFLATSLPDYMLPSAFVGLPALPVTASGKVDRRALPAPERSRPTLDELFVAPGPGVEGELARVWSEMLRIDRVGVHDNFFELGRRLDPRHPARRPPAPGRPAREPAPAIPVPDHRAIGHGRECFAWGDRRARAG